jgi:hypothetical protein
MHNQVCDVCEGRGLLLVMRAGVLRRRDPSRVISNATKLRCPSCAGRRSWPVPGSTLAGRRLPAI